MELQTVRMEHNDGIALVTINHPPVNAITAEIIDDLDTVFTALEQIQSLRCVVLSSALDKVFIAGADINQFLSWKRADGLAVTRRGHDVFLKVENLSKPVICAINGSAFGGGLELALACDIRVIDSSANIGLPETGLGIIPGYGGTQRLPRLVGPGMAKKLILSGLPISGEEAYRIGIAEVLAEKGQTHKEAMKIATRIAKQAPLAVTAAKQCIALAIEQDLYQGIEQEIQSVGDLAESADKTEGAKAFLEKRPANFTSC